jgi:type IV secretion system protein VirD4
MAAVGSALFLAAWIWLAGQIAGWAGRGHWPAMPAEKAGGILIHLPSHLADPARAWPRGVQPQLAGPVLFYAVASTLFAPLAAAAFGWRRRRSGWARSRRDHGGAEWARRRDLRTLALSPWRRPSSRLILGRTGFRSTPLATESRHSVLVVGPTQSGKTTSLAIPAILRWDGPVVATSVKDDLASTTLGWRARRGPCWMFDPTGSTRATKPARWSPLTECQDWAGSQRMAAWLVEATPARSGVADAAFWYAAAAKQLAPLLLAAGLCEGGMARVVRWTNTCDFDEPHAILAAFGEGEAVLALAACAGRDERIRSSVATTLETVLAPFEDPVVAVATAASDFVAGELLGRRGTLYVCGPSHEQHRIQALFAALVSGLVAEALLQVGRTGKPLDPPLLLVLDEAANIAPIRDLDTLAATGAGVGIQLVTVCQDLSQLSARYGTERSRTIANNHRAKLLLSGVSDLTTLDLISGLAGERAVRQETVTHDLRDGRRTRSNAIVFRRLAPTDELRRVAPGHGVLVYGHLPPVQLRLRPWYRDRRLRRRVAGTPPPADPASLRSPGG